MNERRDPDRLIHSFVLEGAERLDDQVYDAVRAAIDVKRQRAVIGPWRMPTMNKLALTATAAGLLLVAVLGSTMLPGLTILGPGATPSPSSAEPSSAGDGSLAVGPHLVVPIGDRHGEDRVMVTIPAPGWFAPDSGSLTKDLGGGDRVTVVVVPGDYYTMPPNICNWRVPFEERDSFSPATADGLVAYLKAQTYDTPNGSRTRDFSAPEDVTIAFEHGQRIVNVVREYPDSDPSACDEQRFCSVLDRDNYGCLLSHSEPGALDTLWAVNPSEMLNRRIYLLIVAASGSPSAGLREEMNRLVGSMTFHVD